MRLCKVALKKKKRGGEREDLSSKLCIRNFTFLSFSIVTSSNVLIINYT